MNRLEVVNSAFDQVKDKFPHQDLDFKDTPPGELVEEIIEEGRAGYLLYDRASIITTEGKTWAMLLGTRTRGYLADNILFDWEVFPYDSQSKNAETIKEDIRNRMIKLNRPKYADSILFGVRNDETPSVNSGWWTENIRLTGITKSNFTPEVISESVAQSLLAASLPSR